MKNFRRFALPALILMLVLTACGGNKNEAAAEAAPEEDVDVGTVTKLGNYIGVKLTRESSEPTDEEVDEFLQGVVEANPDYVKADKEAENGDYVVIDYAGTIDGEEFDGGSAEGYELLLGGGGFIDGFEDGLIGSKAGDKVTLNLTFPDYYYEELAGKDVVFNVTVNQVKEEVPSVLDDDFVQRISDFSTVDELREDAVEMVRIYKEYLSTSQLQVDAFNAVKNASEFELNQDFLEDEVEQNMGYVESMASAYGYTMEDFVAEGYGMNMDEYEEYCRDFLTERMQQSLLADAIIEKENMELDEDDLQYVADIMGSDLDSLMENDPEYMEYYARLYKVINFIVENADITDEE